MSLTYQFSHDVDSVFALMTDPDFLVDRCLDLGELSAECEVEEDGDNITIQMTREVSRDIPKFLAKVFSAEQTLIFTEKWHSEGDSKVGSYVVKVVGQPVTVSATFKLSPTSKGCEYTIKHSAKAKIPLIGGKIEKFIEGQTGDGVGKEMEYLKGKL